MALMLTEKIMTYFFLDSLVIKEIYDIDKIFKSPLFTENIKKLNIIIENNNYYITIIKV